LHRRVRQHPPLDPLVDSPLGRRVHQRRRTVSKALGAAPQRAREAELLRRDLSPPSADSPVTSRYACPAGTPRSWQASR
jgi:hypothetical protein